jgi:hypothetical protein
MGYKYQILYKNYDDKYYLLYQCHSFIKFMFKLFSLKRKYECIDIEIRN